MDQTLQGPTGGAPVAPTRRQLMLLAEDMGVASVSDAAKYARAVLSRWGHQPARPAEGEVAELVALIRQISLAWEPEACLLGNMTAGQLTRAAALLERQAAPVPVAALSSDYREPWDMSSEDGSQCFASAILSRLVGVDAADEADARWLAAYLQANSRPQHFQPASVPVSERLLELTEAFKDLPPGRIELLPEDAQVIEPTEHTILVPARTPVPVAERLPGAKDCDGEGRCWWLAPETAQKCAVWCFGPKYPPSMFGATHWLPATALPLPQGEVE